MNKLKSFKLMLIFQKVNSEKKPAFKFGIETLKSFKFVCLSRHVYN